MALARQHGKDDHRWGVVSEFVLKLSEPHYYQSPVVRYGYMRGSETVGYVRSIRQRYALYRGVKAKNSVNSVPQKSKNEKHRQKFNL